MKSLKIETENRSENAVSQGDEKSNSALNERMTKYEEFV